MSTVIKLKIINYVYITFFSALISGSLSVMVYNLIYLNLNLKLGLLYAIIFGIGLIGILKWRKKRKGYIISTRTSKDKA